jgi:hypothetical protein
VNPPPPDSSRSLRGPFRRWSDLSNRGKAVVLLLFAPFLAELVSSSTPPQAWILPPVLLAFVAIYGVSALVIRDLAVRVRPGRDRVLRCALSPRRVC